MKSLGLLAAVALTAVPLAARAQARPAEIVLVETAFTAAESTVVVRDLATGRERAVATLPHVEGYGATGNVSPDGTHLAVTVLAAGNRLWRHAAVYVVDLVGTAQPRRVLDEAMFAPPVWVSNDTLFAVRQVGEHEPAVEESQHGRLMDLDLEVVAIPQLGAAPNAVVYRDRANGLDLVGMNARGELVATRTAWEGNSLVALRPGSGSARTMAVVGTAVPEWTHVAPDGNSVVYAQVVGGLGASRWGVMRVDLDGNGREVLREGNDHENPVPLANGVGYCTQDGHELALVDDAGRRLATLARDDGAERLVIPRVSSNGRAFVFERVTEEGAARVFVVDGSGAAPIAVSDGQRWREAMGFRGVR